MESGDRCLVGDSIRPIITVPEEIMRKIFSYLPYETLYFSLRKVCTKIQICVDLFINAGESSLLFGRKEGSEIQETEITPIPEKGFIFLRKPLLSFTCVCSQGISKMAWTLRNSAIADKYDIIRLSILKNDTSLDLHSDRRIFKVAYRVNGERVVCYIYKSLIGWTYRFDLDSDKWEKISESFTALKFFEQPYIWGICNEPSHECNPNPVSEDFPYYFDNNNFAYNNCPCLQLKANDGTWLNCKVRSLEQLSV